MFNFFKKKEEKVEKTEEKSLKSVLSNTIGSLVGNVLNVVKNDNIDEFALQDIEDMLIKADIGLDLAVEIVDEIKDKKIKSSELKNFLKEKFSSILDIDDNSALKFDKNKLNIYFVVGVNGAGKTTLIGKLANKFKKEDNKVLLVAGDTFRAAAEEQLNVWATRSGVDIYREDKANSAAVVFKALDKAKEENYNVVIIDSAGRLQNKFNLIEELKKVKNVISKKLDENTNLETMLVLDGSQGQNGLNQAKVFSEATDITSIAITKLDGTPKGGIILAIANELKIPTKLIGVGEKIEDIRQFSSNEFLEALFD